MSSILGGPRTATVTAKTDCTVRFIHSSVRDIILLNPEIAEELLFTTTLRLNNAMHKVVDLEQSVGALAY
jgi:CRP-like cAMP-binding protein